MSADNVRGWEIVRKMKIWPRSEASRANVKFWGQPLSQGYYQPTYQQARKGFIYFITLRLIFIRFNMHGWQFCRLHVFKCGWNFSLFPQSMLKLHENGYSVVSKHNVLTLYSLGLRLRRTKPVSVLATFFAFKDVDSIFCWLFLYFPEQHLRPAFKFHVITGL